MTKDKMVGWHHRLDGQAFEQALGVDDGQGSLVYCSPWGRKESERTEQPNETELSVAFWITSLFPPKGSHPRSVQFSCSVVSDPMDCSMPGFPVHHQLPELAQTHVHQVSDAIQPSQPLSSPLLLPSIFPSARVFSNELALCISWPKYWIYISLLFLDFFPFRSPQSTE